MLVKYWMSKTVVSVTPEASMQDAIYLMKEKNIRSLPVIKKEKLVGIVTDGDLKKASASDATALEIHELLYLLNKIKVKDIMTRDPITVAVDYTVTETAEILLKNKINGVPVVDHKGQVVGVVTQTDLFRVLIALAGAGPSGVQIAFQVENKPGTIGMLTDIIRSYGGRMTSVLTSFDRAPSGYRRVYVSVDIAENTRLERMIEMLEEKSRPLYVIDHVRNIRKINLQSEGV